MSWLLKLQHATRWLSPVRHRHSHSALPLSRRGSGHAGSRGDYATRIVLGQPSSAVAGHVSRALDAGHLHAA
jgi:hypothetical protein